MKAQQASKPRKATHPFVLDTDLPPDSNGRGVCRCGLVGEPNDARHSMPSVPEQADARRRYGERDDA